MKQNYIFILFICFLSSVFCNETLEVANKKKIDEALVDEILAGMHKKVDEDQVDETLSNISNFKTKKYTFSQIKNIIEVKVGYFRPDDKTFRDIYSGGAIYELEGTFQAYKNFYPWVGVDYFNKAGKTLNVKSSTRINLIFIECGLKYMYPINSHSDSLYLGIGAIPSYVNIQDKSQFLVSRGEKWNIGGVFKGGFFFNYSSRIFFDFFIDYKYLKTSLNRKRSNALIFFNKVNLSGFSIGAGLAFHF